MDTLIIPTYPCHSCSYFEELVCMSCEKYKDYMDATDAIRQKYGKDVGATVEMIAEVKDNILALQARVERLTKSLEKEFIVK